jgi:hypothetical protein
MKTKVIGMAEIILPQRFEEAIQEQVIELDGSRSLHQRLSNARTILAK